MKFNFDKKMQIIFEHLSSWARWSLKGTGVNLYPFLKKWCINLSQCYSVPLSNLQISMNPKDDQNSMWLRSMNRSDVLDTLKSFMTRLDWTHWQNSPKTRGNPIKWVFMNGCQIELWNGQGQNDFVANMEVADSLIPYYCDF